MASLHHLQNCWLSPSLTHKPSTTTLFPSKPSPFRLSFSLNPSDSDADSAKPTSQNPPASDPVPVDPVKLAFEKAKAYKKLSQTSNKKGTGLKSNEDSGVDAIGNSVKDKEAKVFNNGGFKVATGTENSGSKGGGMGNSGSGSMVDKNAASKKEKFSVSSIDFMGLNFSDKKMGRRGLPPGLMPPMDTFSVGDLPEVEIIVGDSSNFDDPTISPSKPGQEEEDNPDLYKPKVSTWGVFPRPGNISKTFGGGKTIRPGDVLQTEEERAAKDEKTKQLVAAYKKRMGLNIDPKLKSECEESELHGLAALQWSICLDSLSRGNEARAMYEKLQSHSKPKVSKSARQFVFSFQAMERLKVTGSNFLPESTDYQNYFDAFIEDKINYSLGETQSEEGTFKQALPYIFFLASPIFIVVFIAIQGGNTN
ncbi:uncharacterized protein [Euphorbia lathyris]|uniref:uncharacterized protein isoform X2 n=1 Tax=Euphorbia lathyris TaxID=212925 RepID=UPI003313F160